MLVIVALNFLSGGSNISIISEFNSDNCFVFSEYVFLALSMPHNCRKLHMLYKIVETKINGFHACK